VIDELTGDRQVETATAVIQAQGNLTVGTALTIDRRLAAVFDPRGTVLSTGETDPRRQSTLARMVTTRFTADTVDLHVLSRLQKHARDELFALAMSGFIRWLAHPGRLAQMKSVLRRSVQDIIDEVSLSDPSRRTRHLQAVAELVAGYGIFMRFSVESGALVEITAQAYAETVKKALIDLVDEQAALQRESNPGERFLALLRAGLFDGHFHLRRIDETQVNMVPPLDIAQACGWRQKLFYQGGVGQLPDWEACGKQCGFIDHAAGLVLLDPGVSKSVARTMAREQGAEFENVEMLARDLGLGKVSRTVIEKGKTRFTIQRHVQGVRRYLIEIPSDTIFGTTRGNP
jgi:hypothetical protein